MADSPVTCPSCNHQCPVTETLMETTCPACGSDLAGNQHSKRLMPGEVMDGEQMKKFASADAKLFGRISNITPEASWHLAVISEILDFEYKRLSNTLNDTNSVSNCIFNLKSNKSRLDAIKAQFNEFSNCIGDIQEALINHLDSDCKFPGMVKFWDFYVTVQQAFDRLTQFHRTVVALKFVRDSVENEIQGMMIDWVHYVLICIEGLKKQLDHKSKLEQHQLQVRSVQVTLAPPDLDRFFHKLERLSASDKLDGSAAE